MKTETRQDPEVVAELVTKLSGDFGERAVTTQAVREHHANTTTWIENEAPDAVVFPQTTADVQAIVRICAAHRVPIIPFGAGTSLEGHVLGGEAYLNDLVGTYRTHEVSIGCDPAEIVQRIPQLLANTKYWLDHKTFPIDECMIRFHHQLVSKIQLP